jgi:phosphoribosylformylglycinamidine synthase
LQFGNPEDPEIFWSFTEAIRAISHYGSAVDVPCVGGKVSFYNETDRGPIKPSPVIGVVGLIESPSHIRIQRMNENDFMLIAGSTGDEMGGSEYYEYIHGVTGGEVPRLDASFDRKIMNVMLDLIRSNSLRSVHDCSKGGLAVAVSEMCMASNVGVEAELSSLPSLCSRIDDVLFSESNSRFIMTVEGHRLAAVRNSLEARGIPYGLLGKVGGSSIRFDHNGKNVMNVSIDKAVDVWMNALERIMEHG